MKELYAGGPVEVNNESENAERPIHHEALELFFECASPAEVQQRLTGEVFVTQVEVAVG